MKMNHIRGVCTTAVKASFVPRQTFEISQDIPRSYFLGHHRETLEQMKKMVDQVTYVIECRDFRVPASSSNPVFTEALGNKPRLIIYTKRDLGGNYKLQMQKIEKKIIRWDRKAKVFMMDKLHRPHMLKVLKHIRRLPLDINPATGGRIMVVGMPNVGKSTIINGLRAAATPIGLKAVRAKAAATGADPGITRRIGQGIKLFERRLGPVYLVDTPGVFVPYVEDPISMLKLSLCGIVKDTLISPITKADYILYHINKIKPFCYLKYCPPTNDIQEFLTAFAKGSGCYAKGRVPDLERAAQRWVHLWRSGEIPGFVMDDVDAITEDLRKRHREEQEKAKPSQAAEEQEDYDEGEEQEPDEDVVDYEEDEADEELAASIRSKL